jgi:hypothetical protein
MSQLVKESVDSFIRKESMDEINEAKKKKWIQKAFKSIKKKGTEGKCTGEKFGSESCPPGSKAYNMAKNLRAIAAKKKKKD